MNVTSPIVNYGSGGTGTWGFHYTIVSMFVSDSFHLKRLINTQALHPALRWQCRLCPDSAESAWDSPSLCPSPTCTLCLSQNNFLKNNNDGRAWVAQLVKHLTLDFGSGHDLTIHQFKPLIQGLLGFTVSLSLSLSQPPSLSLSPQPHS